MEPKKTTRRKNSPQPDPTPPQLIEGQRPKTSVNSSHTEDNLAAATPKSNTGGDVVTGTPSTRSRKKSTSREPKAKDPVKPKPYTFVGPVSASVISDQPSDDDQLDFDSYSKALRDLILHPTTKTPLTLGVFGRWGTGKTTLMRMLERALKQEKLATVWFNAWQYSKEDELWAAFLQSVLNKIRDDLPFNAKVMFTLGLLWRRFDWNKLPEAVLQYIGRGLVVVAPLVLAWPIAQQFQQELLTGFIQVGGGVASVVLAAWVFVKPLVEAVRQNVTIDFNSFRQVSDYEKHIAFLDSFREHFTDVVLSLPRQGDKRLAVFIDDLDRCAPDRILQVLDAIKLFVDIPGCVFVLGLDSDIVQTAIATKYKDDQVAQREYLGKIIQLPFQLPPLTRDEMKDFVEQVAVELPDPRCREVFVEGLSANLREIKRTLNIFALLWSLSSQRRELQTVITPVRLAKVVAIQHGYPDLHRILQNRPQLIIELESHFRRETALASTPPAEGQPALSVSPLLQPFLQNEGLRRMLLLHEAESAESDDAGFAHLSIDSVEAYFTLTVQVEAPLPNIGPDPVQQTPRSKANSQTQVRRADPATVTPGSGMVFDPDTGEFLGADSSHNLIGQTLNNRYQIERLLGVGGTSSVYSAYDQRLDKSVAIKVLDPALTREPRFRQRFQKETEILLRLSHPNVVRIFDANTNDRHTPFYLVMDYLTGGSLGEMLEKRSGPLQLSEAIGILGPILDGLTYIHASNIVHRDIKPSAIQFNEQGTPILTDFNIALNQSALDNLTGEFMLGTPNYLSPEQAQGQKIDERSDLYSLGVVLYECLTGRPPFSAGTPLAVAVKHISDPVPAPQSLNPRIPNAVQQVMLKLLAKQPEDRYQSAAAAKEELLRAANPGSKSRP